VFARLGRWCHAHRRHVVALWIGALVALGAVLGAVGTTSRSEFTLPDVESRHGTDILKESFGGVGAGQGGTIVFEAQQGVDDPEVKAAMERLFAQTDDLPGVTVRSPYAPGGVPQISSRGESAGKVAYADVDLPADASVEDGQDVGRIDVLTGIAAEAGLEPDEVAKFLRGERLAREVQAAILYVLIFPATILTLTALSSVVAPGLKGLNNAGPHGLTEILYAFSSTTGNNGSAFAGLTGSTYYYNTLLGAVTLVGRFAMIVPMVALAGFLSERKIAAATAGTFPVTTPLFVMLLLGVILIVGALTFVPALSLGPVVEHLLMLQGRLF